MEVEPREQGLSSAPRRVLMVTIEGLGTNLVGAYGNAICPTPNWDKFAVNGITCDHFWMDSTSTHDVLQSICTGRHHAVRRGRGTEPACSTEASNPWIGLGVQSPGLFVTDDAEACEVAERFLEGVQVCMSGDKTGADATDFESLLTKSFELWTERMETLPWLWIHAKGLSGPWDAPLEYRSRMCDEGDPDPPTSTVPPDLWLEKDPDPDIAFGWSCGAGAQAIAMDEGWVWVDRFLREMSLLDSCLVVLAGVQGFPLGEHRRIGLGADSKKDLQETASEQKDAPELGEGSCYAERLHCPLLMRPGSAIPLGWRLPQCIQPHQLSEWIEAWLGDEPSFELQTDWEHEANPLPSDSNGLSEWSKQLTRWDPAAARSAWDTSQRTALAIGANDLALVVPSWSSRWIWDARPIDSGHGDALERDVDAQPTHSVQDRSLRDQCVIPGWLATPVPLSRMELYVHPEDRWQQNEVGDRAAAILELLVPVLNAWIKLQEVGPEELERVLWTLDASLIDPVR